MINGEVSTPIVPTLSRIFCTVVADETLSLDEAKETVPYTEG